MTDDKNIDCMIIDAKYIGQEKCGFTGDNQYRFRTVRLKGELIKIRLYKNSSDIHIYKDETHFESYWTSVKKIASASWYWARNDTTIKLSRSFGRS